MAGGQDPHAHERENVVTRLRLASAPRPSRALPCHVMVTDAPELPGERPGLLLAWDRRESGWVGQVAVGAHGAQGAVVMVLWVEAARLRPV